MSRSLNRRAALGAGLASLMPAPFPAILFGTAAAVPQGVVAATAHPTSLDAVAAVPEVAARAAADDPSRLRGDNTVRLPDHAALWSRMPLPFTPAEAWRLLSAETQAEIGAAVIGMALAEYVGGEDMAEADQFLDEGLTHAAIEAQFALLNAITPRLWVLFPDLYGPDGDHPAWALDSGMARPLPG